MARHLASLPTGRRVTGYISLGLVSRAIPREKIDSILASTGKASVRQRELPAHLVVYSVIALALYMQSSYREVLALTAVNASEKRSHSGRCWTGPVIRQSPAGKDAVGTLY